MTSSSAPEAALDRARLRAEFSEAQVRARTADRPLLASVLLTAPAIDPLAAFARSEGMAHTRAFWSSPERGLLLAGIDVAWSAEGAPGQVAAAWRRLTNTAMIDAPDGPTDPEPMLLAGFAFDPDRSSTPDWTGYPAGLAILPRLIVSSAGGATRVRLSAIIAPNDNVEHETERSLDLLRHLLASGRCGMATGSSCIEEVMPADRWRGIVAGAVDDLEPLGLEKVVLARSVRVRREAPYSVGAILRRIHDAYPSCFVFAFARGGRCFLGATPEQLIALRSDRIDAVSLAGTAARGGDTREDEQLAAALVASAKDQHEHSVVVRAMREALACAGAHEISSGEPVVLKLPNVQHLQTSLTARPEEGTGVLDLVARLHPTPAVGGYPRARALQFIREREALDRGWYAGPIGWMDAAGEGEFAVALRSALVHGNEALLFAGCGIVAGSDPASEYAESCLKLRPMLAALGVGPGAVQGVAS